MGRVLSVGVRFLILLLVRNRSFNVVVEMEKHSIVPDVISVAPKEMAIIKYGNFDLQLGNELTPVQVKDPPTSVEWNADEDSLYTLAMIGPDAPSRQDPKYREWQHWLVVNIPGSNIAEGETLTEYTGSRPGEGTGRHRYIFLIYKQNERMVTDDMEKIDKSWTDRINFSIEKFALEHNLGDPVAGNFYQAQWDENVPLLYDE